MNMTLDYVLCSSVCKVNHDPAVSRTFLEKLCGFNYDLRDDYIRRVL